MKTRPKAVFLDRDGVLIREAEYLASIDGLHVYKSTAKALKLLRAAGFKIIIVTNQSGVARGYFPVSTVNRIHTEIKRRLAKQGARWDALYVSPHGPKSKHPWRKPGTGMLLAAKRRFGLDLKGSFLVGDKTGDIECGRRAGCTTILVKTGYAGSDKKYKVKPDVVSRDILTSARWIIAKRV